ncbi:glycosyltransferase [Desulfovibrio inopinatus]|uniref:glycosyltransferase n=1 Tax=Desulfovibrio inopinatus TaxID=102109 RepID=UPI000A06F216
METLFQVEYLFAHDQDLLNKVLKGHVSALDCSWNYQWTWMLTETGDLNIQDINILHYSDIW